MAVALRGSRRCWGAAGTRPTLPINFPSGTHGPCQQLGRVTAGSTEIERHDPRSDANKGKHLLRFSTQIIRAIGCTAIRAGDDLRDLFLRERRRLRIARLGHERESENSDDSEAALQPRACLTHAASIRSNSFSARARLASLWSRWMMRRIASLAFRSPRSAISNAMASRRS